jgi:uncharacterized membrane protein
LSGADELRSLPDEDLVARGLAAASASGRRAVEYEMWRRQSMLSRRAILVADESGKSGVVAGRWAITLALFAVALTLLVGWTVETDPMRKAFYLVYLVLVLLMLAAHGVTLFALMREWLAARAKLRAFDAEHAHDASG